MKVIVMVKATKESEAGEIPSEQLLTEMGKYNEELVKAGIMLAGEGLHPSSKGARVVFADKQRAVVDGPFAETKELVAGFWMWQVKSLEEAIEWAKRCPNPMKGGGILEIRPVFSAEDFGESYTPELRAQEERMRSEIEGYQLDAPRYEQGREMLVAGMNASYSTEDHRKIPEQWHRFAERMGSVPGKIGGVSYGVSWNHKPPCNFDYLTGVEVAEGTKSPADLTQVRLHAGRYAVFCHKRPIAEFSKTIDAIWKTWLPNSGHKAANAPIYERYAEDFDMHTGQGLEIWIPLQS